MAGISPPLGGPLRQPAERSFLKGEGILAQNISPLQVPCYRRRRELLLVAYARSPIHQTFACLTDSTSAMYMMCRSSAEEYHFSNGDLSMNDASVIG